MKTQTIKPSQLMPLLQTIWQINQGLPAYRQLVAYIKSAPGLGKSSIIADFARQQKLRFTDTRLAYAAPTDVRGFPMVVGGERKQMEFAPPGDYPRTPGNVWLLDEFSCASRATQMAALQLLLDKRVGDYVVPDESLLILAGNRAIDRAHVERLSTAVINRVVQITLEADVDDWVDWAATAGVDPRVTAFVRFRPELLSSFDAAKWDGDDGFASPRSWVMVDAMLQSDAFNSMSRDLRQIMVKGALGIGPGTEFGAFLNTYEKLPDINKILKDPDKAKVPDEPDIQVALCAAFVPRFDKKHAGAILTYTDRMQKEFQVLTVRLAAKRDNSIFQCKEVLHWMTENKEVFIDSGK